VVLVVMFIKDVLVHLVQSNISTVGGQLQNILKKKKEEKKRCQIYRQKESIGVR